MADGLIRRLYLAKFGGIRGVGSNYALVTGKNNSDARKKVLRELKKRTDFKRYKEYLRLTVELVSNLIDRRQSDFRLI